VQANQPTYHSPTSNGIRGTDGCSPQSNEEFDLAQVEAQLLDLSIRQHPYELDLFICDLAMVTN
jgi:hypothetical protein